MILFIFLLLIAQAHAYTILFASPDTFQGQIGTQDTANDYCVFASARFVNCSSSVAYLYYRDRPVTLSEPIYDIYGTLVAQNESVLAAATNLPFGSFWRGELNSNCNDWDNRYCNNGRFGNKRLSIGFWACNRRLRILCACFDGRFVPSLSPTQQPGSTAPSKSPTRRPTKFPTTLRPTGTPTLAPSVALSSQSLVVVASPGQKLYSTASPLFVYDILRTGSAASVVNETQVLVSQAGTFMFVVQYNQYNAANSDLYNIRIRKNGAVVASQVNEFTAAEAMNAEFTYTEVNVAVNDVFDFMVTRDTLYPANVYMSPIFNVEVRRIDDAVATFSLPSAVTLPPTASPAVAPLTAIGSSGSLPPLVGATSISIQSAGVYEIGFYSSLNIPLGAIATVAIRRNGVAQTQVYLGQTFTGDWTYGSYAYAWLSLSAGDLITLRWAATGVTTSTSDAHKGFIRRMSESELTTFQVVGGQSLNRNYTAPLSLTAINPIGANPPLVTAGGLVDTRQEGIYRIFSCLTAANDLTELFYYVVFNSTSLVGSFIEGGKLGFNQGCNSLLVFGQQSLSIYSETYSPTAPQMYSQSNTQAGAVMRIADDYQESCGILLLTNANCESTRLTSFYQDPTFSDYEGALASQALGCAFGATDYGTALRGFQAGVADGQFYYSYDCRYVNDQGVAPVGPFNSASNVHTGDYAIDYEGINVSCNATHQVIATFEYKIDFPSEVWYEYRCMDVKIPVTDYLVCLPYSTTPTQITPNYTQLELHDVLCPLSDQALQYFELKTPTPTTFQYDYTCCRIEATQAPTLPTGSPTRQPTRLPTVVPSRSPTAFDLPSTMTFKLTARQYVGNTPRFLELSGQYKTDVNSPFMNGWDRFDIAVSGNYLFYVFVSITGSNNEFFLTTIRLIKNGGVSGECATNGASYVNGFSLRCVALGVTAGDYFQIEGGYAVTEYLPIDARLSYGSMRLTDDLGTYSFRFALLDNHVGIMPVIPYATSGTTGVSYSAGTFTITISGYYEIWFSSSGINSLVGYTVLLFINGTAVRNVTSGGNKPTLTIEMSTPADFDVYYLAAGATVYFSTYGITQPDSNEANYGYFRRLRNPRAVKYSSPEYNLTYNVEETVSFNSVEFIGEPIYSVPTASPAGNPLAGNLSFVEDGIYETKFVPNWFATGAGLDNELRPYRPDGYIPFMLDTTVDESTVLVPTFVGPVPLNTSYQFRTFSSSVAVISMRAQGLTSFIGHRQTETCGLMTIRDQNCVSFLAGTWTELPSTTRYELILPETPVNCENNGNTNGESTPGRAISYFDYQQVTPPPNPIAIPNQAYYRYYCNYVNNQNNGSTAYTSTPTPFTMTSPTASRMAVNLANQNTVDCRPYLGALSYFKLNFVGNPTNQISYDFRCTPLLIPHTHYYDCTSYLTDWVATTFGVETVYLGDIPVTCPLANQGLAFFQLNQDGGGGIRYSYVCCQATASPTPVPTTLPTSKSPSQSPTIAPTSKSPSRSPTTPTTLNPTLFPTLQPTLTPTVGEAFIQNGAKLVGTGNTGAARQGNGVAISADGTTAAVGGASDNSFQGAVWIYTRSGATWTQQGSKLVGTGNSGAAAQGEMVALSADGNTVAWSGRQDGGSLIGAVWVWTRTAGVWTQQGSKLVPSDYTGTFLFLGRGVSLSQDGNTLSFGGSGDNSNIGATWVYTRSSGTWTQEGSKLVGTGATGIATQGWDTALSADGRTLAVGGISDDTNNGAVWIFVKATTSWAQQGSKLVGTGATGAARQGTSVALSSDGNTLLVGGETDNTNQGGLWVFLRTGATWAQQGSKLVATGGVGTPRLGYELSVSSDGNRAITAGYADNSNAGAFWTWERSSGSWTQTANKLVGTGGSSTARQGISLAISMVGNNAVIGGDQDNSNQGAAWMWDATTTRPALTLYQQQGSKLVGTGGSGLPRQGSSNAISGDALTMATGAINDGGSSVGAVWIFTRSGATWTQQGSKLFGTGAVGNANQGISIALSNNGDTVAWGGNFDNTNTGAVWVWTRTAGVWSQQGSKLVGTGLVTPSQFGISVSLSSDGDTLVVGASADNANIGCAHVFIRSAGVWSQQGSKLVGTGATGTAQQGTSVAVSGDGNTLVLGGRTDNTNLGAAWVFTRSAGVWTQQGSKLVGSGAVGASEQGVSVSLSSNGDTLIVGGWSDDSSSGAMWVYTRSAGVWSQDGSKVVPTNQASTGFASGSFGGSSSLSSDGLTFVAGARFHQSNTGSVWVFRKISGTWTQQGSYYKASDFTTGLVNMGRTVSLSSNATHFAFGGWGDNSNQGASWVFGPLP